MISTAAIVWLSVLTLFGVALPVCTLLYWRKTRHARLLPSLVGAVTFLIFSQGLEAVLHYFCLASDNTVSRAIMGSTALYVLYGTLAAGIFEETGRFVAFKTLLRRYPERDTAISYGIGHGGIEAFVVLGVVSALNLAAALLYRSGGEAALLPLAGSEEAVPVLMAQLSANEPAFCLLAMLERVLAMILHVALSVFVFIAARDREKRWYYPLAIVLHAIFDVPAALYQRGVLPLWAVELWAAVFGLYLFRSARKRFLERTDP